nr:30S ribosomal protein S8 [uncultured archaeon]
MLHDLLADALAAMRNAEKRGKSEVVVKFSNIIIEVFNILKKEKYLVDFEVVKDKRGNSINVKLSGAINNVGVIKPRFSVKIDNFEKFEKRYLPAKDFGFVLVSTSKGIMTHNEAKTKKLGGVLLAYVY